MKFLKLTYYFFTLVAILIMAVACNSDKDTPAEVLSEREIIITEPQELPAAENIGQAEKSADTAIAPLNTMPVKKGSGTTSPATPKQKEATPKQPEVGKSAPAAPSGMQEGTYRLARVQGEELPLVLDMTTECDVKLLSGELILKEGGFRFKSHTAEECSGKTGNQEIQQATGSYRVEGNQLVLTVSSGEVLGDAKGLIEGNKLRLQHISNDVEEQEVDWLFELK